MIHSICNNLLYRTRQQKWAVATTFCLREKIETCETVVRICPYIFWFPHVEPLRLLSNTYYPCLVTAYLIKSQKIGTSMNEPFLPTCKNWYSLRDGSRQILNKANLIHISLPRFLCLFHYHIKLFLSRAMSSNILLKILFTTKKLLPLIGSTITN